MRITPKLARDPERQRGLGSFDTISPLFPWFGQSTQASKYVSVKDAYGLAAVLACVRMKANTVGQLPLITKEWLGRGEEDAQVAYDDPMYRLLKVRPNPEMSAITAWSYTAAHLNSWGEAFIGKTFVPGVRRPVALWPIDPDRVDVERVNGEKIFWVRDQYFRRKGPYTQADIIHVMGFTLDGLRGASPIQLAREAIGAGLALDEYANRFWANGGILSGVFSTDKQLEEDVADRLEKRLMRKYRGPRNSGRFAVLEEGLKYQAISMKMSDAQFVEQQKWSLQQAARVIGVPLSLVGADVADSSLTYRTVEGDNLHYLMHYVNPDLVRIEQAFDADEDLFPDNRKFSEFDVRKLLRTNALEQAKVFAIETGGRAYRHPTEIRKAQGLGPDPGPQGSLDEAPPTERPPGESPPSLR